MIIILKKKLQIIQTTTTFHLTLKNQTYLIHLGDILLIPKILRKINTKILLNKVNLSTIQHNNFSILGKPISQNILLIAEIIQHGSTIKKNNFNKKQRTHDKKLKKFKNIFSCLKINKILIYLTTKTIQKIKVIKKSNQKKNYTIFLPQVSNIKQDVLHKKLINYFKLNKQNLKLLENK